MKIFLDNVDLNSSSGPNRFAMQFLLGLTMAGHQITGPDECDVHLCFIEQRTQHRKDAVLVQRLDGIWFKPEQFLSHNASIKRLYDSTHGVIFQSDFDRRMVTHHWNDPVTGRSRVIRNGGSYALPRVGMRSDAIRGIVSGHHMVFCSAARWHGQKRLEDDVNAFEHITQTQGEKNAMFVIGDVPQHEMRRLNRLGIFWCGEQPIDACLELMASSNWMLHLAWLDHSPNTVVQSMSMGTPVICSSTGGTHELLEYGDGFIVTGEPEYDFSLADYDDPPRVDVVNGVDVSRVTKVQSKWTRPIDVVVGEYVQFFENLLGWDPRGTK